MDGNNRAIEVLKYLQEGGYNLQDLIEALSKAEIELLSKTSRMAESAQTKAIDQKKTSLNKRVAEMLQEMRIPQNLSGYQQLKVAIVMVYKERALLRRMTTELYPAVAEKFGTTSAGIDRNIRHAIEAAFARMTEETATKYFRYSVAAEKGKLSNSEFIASLVERLYLEEEE